MLTRWQRLYAEMSEQVRSVPPAQSAHAAAQVFAAHGKRLILDLGCGRGRDSVCLATYDLRVVAVDAAETGLRLSASHPGKAAPMFVCADARKLSLRDALFDGVYCFGLLHEFTGETRTHDVDAVMREVRRVLAPGGILVLAVLSGDPAKGLPHVYLFSESEFDRATRGLRVLDKREFDDTGCTGRGDYRVWYGVFQT